MTALPGLGLRGSMELLLRRPADGRNAQTAVGPRSRAKLVVAGEVGGRWSAETSTFLRLLAAARARSETQVLRKRAEQVWRLRWSTMLACTAARAFAASLLE